MASQSSITQANTQISSDKPSATALTDAVLQQSLDGTAGSSTTNGALKFPSYNLTSAYTNWYQTPPYQFQFTARNGTTYSMMLPISPSNLNIRTHYATNVVATLYGTVEQHSEQRYFDITIEGTTGMAPQFVSMTTINPSSTGPLNTGNALTGRPSFAVQSSLSSVSGFLQQTIGAAAQVLNAASNAIDVIRGNASTQDTGLIPKNSGYAAFHNLYRFFQFYKADTAGYPGDNGPRTNPSIHPLVFVNYKDNNKYDVSIQNFTLRRSADNPMLYFYSITLKAYNLNSANAKIASVTVANRLAELGLDGINGSSVFNTMKGLASSLKSGIGAAGGLVTNIGR